MNVYIYQAALYCEDCGKDICERLCKAGNAPSRYELQNELFDSDDYPKGPYLDGGGESDSEEYCDACGCALENPLTTYGQDQLDKEN